MCKKLLLPLMAMLVALAPASAQKRYKNPVYGSDFPDPTVVRAPDGTFYAYATNCQCRKSPDLINWTGVSGVIDRPTWNDTGSDYYSLWAADVNYVDGKYLLYYACALWGNGSRTGIGVATGTSPVRFKDAGKMFRSTEIGVANSIDPCYVEEFDKKYLVWGSFNDLCLVELTDDGLAVKNFSPLDNPNNNPSAKRHKGVVKLAGGAFEGAMIYKRGQYYYLFASVGSCCEGYNSTYRTVVGRSTSLKGPYVNKQGGSMIDNNYTTIISGNDRWKGPGHNSEIVTDDAGQDWLLYHSYDTKKGPNARVLVLDKITWGSDGWPTVNDGHPSSEEQDAPVFYTGDGANVSYKFQNLDLMRSGWHGWDTSADEGCTLLSGRGTAFFPVGGVKTPGAFDMHQTVTGLPDGIYEMRSKNFSSNGGVDLYVNDIPTPAINATQAGLTNMSAENVMSNAFLRNDKYLHSAYGMVTNGKLTIGVRSNDGLAEGDRFYMGGVQVIYREKNADAVKSVLSSYNTIAKQLMQGASKYYSGYGPALERYLQLAEATDDDDERYEQLVHTAKSLDSINTSILLYDSLSRETAVMQEAIERAKEGEYLSEEAVALCNEAGQAWQSANYSNRQVEELIARMRKAAYDMLYSYQQGDGTQANPYIIRRPEQLDHMHDVLVKEQMIYFAMEADVDMAGYNWKQLNTSDNGNRYWISLDGRGHIIRNLTPDGSKYYPSFFGTLCGECRNVGFVDAHVEGESSGAGVLCGYMGHSTYKDGEGNPLPVVVENCYFTGSIVSKGYVGSVGGTLHSSPITIRNVYSAVDITGIGASANYCGGIVGRVRTPLTLEYAYATGAVNGPYAAPIVAGGQSETSGASLYNNVIAWCQEVGGKTVAPWGITSDQDQLQEVYFLDEVKVNGEKVDDAMARSHAQLQQIAATWGAPWHADPTAGNGYPILQWQFDRGDYRQLCGFPIEDDITSLNASQQPANGAVYDLSGRLVAQPSAGSAVPVSLQRGIYIQDGRKVYVR